MKKVFTVIAVLSILCSMAACGEKAETASSADEALTVVSQETSSSEEPASASESEQVSEPEAVSEAETSSSEQSSAEEEQISSETVSQEESQSSSDGATVYEGVSIVLPEGFTTSDDLGGGILVAYPPDYPTTTDNIAFNSTSESADLYTQENIDKTMQTFFDESTKCENYKKYSIDGYDAVSYDLATSRDDFEFEQTQVVVFGEKTVIISFTSISGTYDDAFRKSIDTIRVNK